MALFKQDITKSAYGEEKVSGRARRWLPLNPVKMR